MTMKPKIFIAGHRGMAGNAILKNLQNSDCEVITRSRTQLDLTDQYSVKKFFQNENIDQVYLAAAKVGGIFANNTYPGEFIYENLMIQSNVIHEAFKGGVKKLLFLGSSCIYPKFAKQPILEESLLSGYLETTNEAYAIAKIAGIKLCESYNKQYGESHDIDYRCVMPTNLYGLGDNYHDINSHVIPGLINRIHEAKLNNSSEVRVWGTGKPLREFLYSEDLGSACVFIMNAKKSDFKKVMHPRKYHINLGSGVELSIKQLAYKIKKVVGYTGKVVFDDSKPDGTPRKIMDSSRLTALGWKSKTDIDQGLEYAYKDFIKIKNQDRGSK